MVKPSFQSQAKRAACDHCRRRKLKCTGEPAACSRCRAFNLKCSYSAQKPRGRPRKPLQETADMDQNSGHGSAERPETEVFAPSDSQLGPRIEKTGINTNTGAGQDSVIYSADGGDLLGFGELLAGVPDDYHNEELTAELPPMDYPVQLSLPSFFATPEQRPPVCGCFFSLDKAIDAVRSMEEPEFPSSLRMLREAVGTAFPVVDCTVCPLSYMAATQNGLLVCTLVIYIAQSYHQLLRFIDDEEQRCARGNITKTLQLGELSAINSSCSHAAAEPGVDTLAFETTAAEWKTIAVKALKAQIYGVSEQRLHSFTFLLERLRERQTSWHSKENCFAYSEPDHVKVGQPPCLILLDEADRTMQKLSFLTNEKNNG